MKLSENAKPFLWTRPADYVEIVEEVDASRARIREADPTAYVGFVTDAACRAVGKRREMRAVDVLRCWRQVHPRKRPSSYRYFPADAREPNDAALAVA